MKKSKYNKYSIYIGKDNRGRVAVSRHSKEMKGCVLTMRVLRGELSYKQWHLAIVYFRDHLFDNYHPEGLWEMTAFGNMCVDTADAFLETQGR